MLYAPTTYCYINAIEKYAKETLNRLIGHSGCYYGCEYRKPKPQKLTALMIEALSQLNMYNGYIDTHGCLFKANGYYVAYVKSPTFTAMIDRKYITLDRETMQWSLNVNGYGALLLHNSR